MAKATLKKKTAYDPGKQYKWEPDDVFEITGLNLASLYHTLNVAANSTDGPTPAMIYEAYSVVLQVLQRGVEDGVIQEQDSNPQDAVKQVEGNVRNLFKQ